jgi:hypothetical protein
VYLETFFWASKAFLEYWQYKNKNRNVNVAKATRFSYKGLLIPFFGVESNYFVNKPMILYMKEISKVNLKMQ